MQTNLKSAANPIVSVDWFCMWGTYLPKKDTSYCKFVGDESTSAMWRHIIKVSAYGQTVGTLCYGPRSNMLGENVAMFTADNALLYKCGWYLHYQAVADRIGFVPQSITRVDFALDFQMFNNGMKPRDLITAFFNEDVRKVGLSKWRAVGECRDGIVCEYLAFGSRSSSVFTRLYNKSKELREQVRKTYIEDLWKKGGMAEGADVWRLEFQIQAKDFHFVNAETGEVGDLLAHYFIAEYPLQPVIDYLCRKYFDFRLPTGGRNSTRWQTVDLFGELNSDFVRLNKYQDVKTAHAEKVLLSALHHYCGKYRTEKEDIIKACKTLIRDLTIRGHMRDWYKAKKEDWYPMPELTRKTESAALIRNGRKTILDDEEEE